MTDAGFYRGTNADQDGRFTDKEKKLLKQMKFEDNLERKIDMTRVNLDIIKPWISMRIAEILGIEDDVVTEYVFTQLEEKTLNPKVMQINITGFLNARRAREFMGELWKLLIEAEESDDGIPQTLVEKKLSEMRMGSNGAGDASDKKDNVAIAVAENDWKHRYTTLSGGSYYGPKIQKEKDDRIYTENDRPPRRERDSSRGRDKSPRVDRAEERRREFDEREKKRLERREEEKKREAEELDRRRKDRERREEERRVEEKRRREKERERERERIERKRRSRSVSRDHQRRRKFTEGKRRRSPSKSESDSEDEKRNKKKKKHARRSSDGEERERREKKDKKKSKKEKKKKERKRTPTPSSSSGSDSE